MDVIARELDFPPELTIAVCLAPDRLYNVEDTLAAAILEQSEEGGKAQYLRCLDVEKRKESWGQAAGAVEKRRKAAYGLDEVRPVEYLHANKA